MQQKDIINERKRFRLTGISPILGSSPMNKSIFSDFVATKAKIESQREAAKDDVNDIVDGQEKTTGFYRDRETGIIIMKDYQIKGFFKEAGKALKDTIGIGNVASKVDQYVFFEEPTILITRNGETFREPDDYLERPLRGDTAQGPRVSLARSEMITEGWQLEFTVLIVENKKTAKSVPMDMSVIEKCLDYGRYKGLLQWRNAGYGSFTWEEIPIEE